MNNKGEVEVRAEEADLVHPKMAAVAIVAAEVVRILPSRIVPSSRIGLNSQSPSKIALKVGIIVLNNHKRRTVPSSPNQLRIARHNRSRRTAHSSQSNLKTGLNSLNNKTRVRHSYANMAWVLRLQYFEGVSTIFCHGRLGMVSSQYRKLFC
jgi:hypothetical protein